jgi:predicted AAA+ superfamily ATPase
LIENRGINFLLTGSSAGKLRQGGINLLGGRGRHRHLHPFVFRELDGHDFSLRKVMENGSIPSIYFSDAPREDLSA